MTNALHIWEHNPPPATIAEAEKLHRRLSRETTSQNPKFIEFARRLNERFPCQLPSDGDLIDFDADIESNENLVNWPEGPPNGQTNRAVYSLAIGRYLDRVSPFLIKTACDLGLTVYSDVSGGVYLPNGILLTVQGRKSWGDLSISDQGVKLKELTSTDQVGIILTQELRPFFESYGFKKLRGAYARYVWRYDETEHRIGFYINNHPHLIIKLYCYIKPVVNQRICAVADKSTLNRLINNIIPLLGDSI